MEKPDWLRWHARKAATLPECVCLSLNAEPYPISVPAPSQQSASSNPKKAKGLRDAQAAPTAAPIVVATFRNESTADKSGRMLDSHPALQTPEAAERYARLRTHFLDRHPLLPGAGMGVMGDFEEVVTVYDFAKWANAAGWTLPPELDLGVNADPDGLVAGATNTNEKASRLGKDGMSQRGNPSRWTPEFVAEVQAYRDQFGTSATAKHYGVSETIIKRKTKPKRATLAVEVNPAFGILAQGLTGKRR